jgi:hypothetical protein
MRPKGSTPGGPLKVKDASRPRRKTNPSRARRLRRDVAAVAGFMGNPFDGRGRAVYSLVERSCPLFCLLVDSPDVRDDTHWRVARAGDASLVCERTAYVAAVNKPLNAFGSPLEAVQVEALGRVKVERVPQLVARSGVGVRIKVPGEVVGLESPGVLTDKFNVDLVVQRIAVEKAARYIVGARMDVKGGRDAGNARRLHAHAVATRAIEVIRLRLGRSVRILSALARLGSRVLKSVLLQIHV